MRTRITKNHLGQSYILAAHVCERNLWLNPDKVKIEKKSLWN